MHLKSELIHFSLKYLQNIAANMLYVLSVHLLPIVWACGGRVHEKHWTFFYIFKYNMLLSEV